MIHNLKKAGLKNPVLTNRQKCTSCLCKGSLAGQLVWRYFQHLAFYPGSIGATSVIACLIGAAILVFTGVGSWKILLSVLLGTFAMGLLNNALAVNPFMAIQAYYHFIIGGFLFGAVFMATDPVSAAHTESGKWIYGFFIGVITVIIRVFNPAYPEGIMLAVLFMNVFAPLIDYYIIAQNKRRRMSRALRHL